MLRERHILDGIAWDDCAVIAHDGRQVSNLEAELAARDADLQRTGRTLGETRAVRDLLQLVDLAARESWSHDDVRRSRSGGLDPVELRRLRTALRHAALRDEACGTRPHDEASHGSAEPAPSARDLVASALAHPSSSTCSTRARGVGRRGSRGRSPSCAPSSPTARRRTSCCGRGERSGGERTWREAAQGAVPSPIAPRPRRVVALFHRRSGTANAPTAHQRSPCGRSSPT
jgi:hypothetical protein